MTAGAADPRAAPAVAQGPTVTAETVADIVRSKQEGVAVVDVRNAEEFAGGHVAGALNLDSTAFTDTQQVDKLIEQLQNKSQVVVHCAKSVQRGPASAALLKARLEELGVAGPQVTVLEGGFNRFGELYAGDDALVERGPPAPPADTA